MEGNDIKHFLETSETIGKGLGFSHFSPTHILWLIFFVIAAVTLSLFYKKSNEKTKKIMRITVAGLLVADEIFKIVGLIIGGNYLPKYLPLHLCSINIFLIAIHAFKKSKLLDNFLYAVCMTTSLAALLFPTWTKLPLTNFMHIHSFSVHILLALYPLMLTVGGTIKPDPKQIPKCLLLLVGLAIPAYVANLIFDTNFMFLTSAGKTNPLYIFKTVFGSHLWGYPIYGTIIFTVMYLTPYLWKKLKSKSNT
ncbi:MAG: TIGR02206 family membrane protein [Clostridia bacterium]|nr:TIGR02206 family membrane protein [Clostridia bacterium]